jgi:amino acid transporter
MTDHIDLSGEAPGAGSPPEQEYLSVRQAAFIGVGAMVGAGIFALLAVAAEPALGQAGYWLMSVTALFATAGATNAGLYPAPGLSERLAETGQFPPLMARKLGGRVSRC